MWPRHTGDFSLFRIYADSTNKPCNYSPNNVPYHPKKYFPINISGINEGDFTMVFGYPGSTQQYLHSKAVEQIIQQRDPDRIAIRDIKLDIMRKWMEADKGIRIQYAAKYASTSNAWKKWKGEVTGLKRLNAIEVKKENEGIFNQWVAQSLNTKYKYGTVLTEFDKLYTDIEPYQKAKDYYEEIVVRGTDSYKLFRHLSYLKTNPISFDKEYEKDFVEKHFKDYNFDLDQAVFVALAKKYIADINSKFLPPAFLQIFNKKNPTQYLNKIYRQSYLNQSENLLKLIDKGNIDRIIRKLRGDKLIQLFNVLNNHYNSEILVNYENINSQIKRNQKLYMEAVIEQNKDKMLYPDANLTMRVTYGIIEGYEPADGIVAKHYTTLKGIIEKDKPEIYDYNVPARLKELFQLNDYGPYANNLGELPVCFSASNHTTGGNSGSPVIDANGFLIGINFDRCWEGTMSDIMFDPDKCRNIALDMRYMLFLIDKFAGAGYLLNEMDIIEN